MIAPNENSRASEEVTAVASVERASALPYASLQSTRAPHAAELDGLYPLDDFATDGAHRCEDEPSAQEVWYLSAAATAALQQGVPAKWTIVTLCLTCRCVEAFRGATVMRTEWKTLDGAA